MYDGQSRIHTRPVCCTKALCKASACGSSAAGASVLSSPGTVRRQAMALRTSPSSVLAPACEDVAASFAAARPISVANVLTRCRSVASQSCVARRPSPWRRINRPTRESVVHFRLRDLAPTATLGWPRDALARFGGEAARWYGRIEASVAWLGRYRFGVVGIVQPQRVAAGQGQSHTAHREDPERLLPWYRHLTGTAVRSTYR